MHTYLQSEHQYMNLSHPQTLYVLSQTLPEMVMGGYPGLREVKQVAVPQIGASGILFWEFIL